MRIYFQSFSKEARFKDFVQAVKHCDLCSRLCSRNKVMSGFNGNINSKVLFVAEAPGRLGADKTGVPLYGDKTGDNFEALLGNVGWRRDDVFITNSVLCNPRLENGNNDTPSPEEIANCAPYLNMVIELIQPEVIASLGLIALKALENIAPHGRNLRERVGKPISWANRILVPLYHPGPRAILHRSLPNQRSDFMALAKLVHPVKGLLEQKKIRPDRADSDIELGAVTPFQNLLYAILQSLGRLTYFKLTKLLYLVDLFALERLGHSITGEIYLRQQEGPWPPALQKQIPPLEGREVIRSFLRRLPIIEPGPSPRFEINMDENGLEILAEVTERYGHLNNAEIKRAVYRTKPMRYLLEQERQGRDMRKVPIIYKDKISLELDQV